MEQLQKHQFSSKDLWKMIIPLFIEKILAVTVGLVDSLMVASLGETAVSGVSLINEVNGLFICMFAALAAGGAVVTGQYLGNRNMEKAQRSAEQLVIFMAFLAVALTAVVYALRYVIVYVLFGDIEPDVAASAETYFNIVEFSIPFMAMYDAGAAISRIMGDNKTPLRVSFLMNIINVCGNALFIFGFKWGVEGVALPTLLARMFSAVAVICMLRNPKRELHLFRKFRLFFDRKLVGQIVHLGVPNGIEDGLFVLGRVVLLSVVAQFGTAAIASNAIANTVASYETLAGYSVGTVLVTVVSQSVGRKDFAEARYYTRKLMVYSYIALIVTNLALLVALPGIMSLYKVSTETNELAYFLVWIHAIVTMVVWPWTFVLPQTLRGAGDTRFTMVVSTVSLWTIRMFLGIFLAKHMGMGVLGVWIGMFADWIGRASAFIPRYLGTKWQEKGIEQ